MQTKHCSISIDGSESLHSSHINPFRLMISQVTQNFAISSYLEIRPLANETTISLSVGWISSTSSILRTVPLTCRIYLLTAVWVTPKRFATSFCFKPWVCVNSLAMADRMAGTSDLTATSHGSNMFASPTIMFTVERYISMTYVIFYMTYVIKGLSEGCSCLSPFLLSLFQRGQKR